MATLSQLGFKVLTKRPCRLDPNTPLLNTDPPGAFKVPGRNLVIQADQAADVRAKPPAGTFPASEFRYRAYLELLPTGGDNGALAADLSAKAFGATQGFLPSVIVDATIERSGTIFAVTGFEGVDVFDMTEATAPGEELAVGFERTSEGIRVPRRFTGIYKVIHAGSERLIPEGDERGRQFFSTVGPFLESNLSIGTDLNLFAPFDVRAKFEKDGGDPLFADTSSRIIRIDGNPSDVKFISFVGITNPIFRDVVIMQGRSKTESAGVLGTPLQVRNREALTADDRAQVLRFLWNENPSTDQPLFAPKPRWDLSETFTIDPERKWEGSLEKVGLEDDPFFPRQHFVYNLLETTFPSVAGFARLILPIRVLRKGFPPEFANTTISIGVGDQNLTVNAETLEQDFRRERIRIDENDSEILVSNEQQFFLTGQPGLFEAAGILCNTSPERTLRNHAYLFTSPKIKEDVTGRFRLGHEYFSPLGNLDRETSEFVLLARTGPPGSIAAAQDPATGETEIIDAAENGNINVRRALAIRWTNCRELPKSQFRGKFILGEFPYKTDGGSAVVQRGTRVPVTGTEIKIADDEIIIAIGLDVKKDTNGIDKGTFKLFAQKNDEEPRIELTLFDVAPSSDGIISATVTPGTYERFEVGGGFFGASFVAVVKEDDVLREKPTFPELSAEEAGRNWVAPSKIQFGEIPELAVAPKENQSGVLVGRSVSLVNLPGPGDGFNVGVYDSDGRINMMVKGPSDKEYSIIRDIVLRVSVEDPEEDPFLPPAALPNIVFNAKWGTLIITYLYKGSLLSKIVPNNIVTKSITREDGRVTVESESQVIQRIHSILPILAYDPERVSNELGEEIFTSKLVLADPDQSIEVNGDVVAIQSYTAFVGNDNVIHVFIEEESRIIAIKSPDGGITWQKTFDDGFFVFPDEPDFLGSDAESQVVDEARFPHILLDQKKNQCSLFFFVDENLLVTEFPAELLANTPENATEAYRKTIPNFIFGTPNPAVFRRKFTGRGATYARNEEAVFLLDEEDREEPEEGEDDFEEEAATPQRIAAVATGQGQRRVFFKDTEGRLRSLTASDITWRLDENFGQEQPR